MLDRLLITGAAGNLGSVCRQRLGHLARAMRISDMTDLGEAGPNEDIAICDLGDKAGVEALVEGCDGIVHLGGRSVEAPWEVIRNSNVEGMFNLHEAARKHGKPRIVFASSNHAIGFHRQSERLDARSTTRPDGLYGVLKVFGEALASMHHDKFGIETACVRIGSCFPEPGDRRMLSTWLSHDDFVRLIERVFAVPRLGCPIIYGASDNERSWWDNREVAYFGWQPKDNSERFRAGLDARTAPPGPEDPAAIHQGGNRYLNMIHLKEHGREKMRKAA